jgi:four helix bundle protein
MPLIQSFEDLQVWRNARQLNKQIYVVTAHESFRNDFDLVRQMRRCAISVVSNIAEGFERASWKEFRQFLNIAKASAGELRAQLYVALDLGYINSTIFDDLYKQLIIIAKMINSMKTHIEKSIQSKKPGNSAKEPPMQYSMLSEDEILTIDSWDE